MQHVYLVTEKIYRLEPHNQKSFSCKTKAKKYFVDRIKSHANDSNTHSGQCQEYENYMSLIEENDGEHYLFTCYDLAIELIAIEHDPE